MNEHQDLQARIRALSAPLEPRPTAEPPSIEPLPGIRSVLFDIYGTLVISASGDIGLAGERDEDGSFLAALDAAGIEPPAGARPATLKDAIRRSHARSREQGVAFPEVDILAVWREVLGIGSDTVDKTRLARLAVEYECRVNPVWPMPGLKEVLAEIAARGLVLGIVSNAQFYTPLLFSAYFEQTVEEVGFDPDCCIWSYRELKAKPSADLFPQAEKHLLSNHGISMKEAVYVGNDMLNDIYCATQAGCKTVLFAGDRRSLRLRRTDERCTNLKPNATITSLVQLLGML